MKMMTKLLDLELNFHTGTILFIDASPIHRTLRDVKKLVLDNDEIALSTVHSLTLGKDRIIREATSINLEIFF